MCGIHGIVALANDYQPEPAHLKRMGDVSIHRGPDEAGCYVGQGVALGMRRLAIIDVAGGHQPIAAAWCDRVVETLEQAVVSQMVSDVPLGAFVSGGIDSRRYCPNRRSKAVDSSIGRW
jgi:asparagine synthetase B (glutamine-hydrolysing)